MENINPIINEFIKLKLIRKKNFINLSNRTRDKNIKVLKDKNSGIIFLEKYLTKIKYYSAFKKKDIDTYQISKKKTI